MANEKKGLLYKATEVRANIEAHDMFYTQKKLWQAFNVKDYTYVCGGFFGGSEDTITVKDGNVVQGEHITIDDIFDDIENQSGTLGFVKETIEYDEVNHIPIKWNYGSSHFYTKDFKKITDEAGAQGDNAANEQTANMANEANTVEFDLETFNTQLELWKQSNVKNYQCLYGASGEFEFTIAVKDGVNTENEDGLTIDSIFKKIEKSSHDYYNYSKVMVKYDETNHIPVEIHYTPCMPDIYGEEDGTFNFYIREFQITT